MEISFSFNSITGDHIATKFGTCHDSPAVVPCAKYCSDHVISIWMRAKWNFHHIWIVMEKSLVKWVHDLIKSNSLTGWVSSSHESSGDRMINVWFIRSNSMRWRQWNRVGTVRVPWGCHKGTISAPHVRSIVRSPYGGLMVALRRPWGDLLFLLYLGCQ